MVMYFLGQAQYMNWVTKHCSSIDFLNISIPLQFTPIFSPAAKQQHAKKNEFHVQTCRLILIPKAYCRNICEYVLWLIRGWSCQSIRARTLGFAPEKPLIRPFPKHSWAHLWSTLMYINHLFSRDTGLTSGQPSCALIIHSHGIQAEEGSRIFSTFMRKFFLS